MLIKYQDGKFYPYLFIHLLLMLEGLMVMFSLTYPPWRSITENKWKTFIAELSDFNRKLCSLEKISLLQDFSSSTQRYCQIVINSNNSLRPRWQISSHSLSYGTPCLENNGKFSVYKGIDIHGNYHYLEMLGAPTQCTTSGQRSHHFSTSYSIKNYIASLHIFIAAPCTRKKIIFEYYEGIGYKADVYIILAQNSSHQVLEEILISSTPFMVKKQMNHQWSGSDNLQQLTSNPGTLLPTPSLWFQISWEDLIIIQLIMVMLKFTHQIFQLNITLNQSQIPTPLRLIQMVMIKWIIS